MNKRVYTEIALEPGCVGVLGSLIYGKRDCSHQSDTCHRRRDPSKETPPLLGLVCVPNAVRKAVIFVRLHSCLHGVQGKLWVELAIEGSVARRHWDILRRRR